ncbi:MAG: hypothetical protein ABFS42_11770 [Candidatus Krumholzibacteriota bacterium]
MVLLTAAILCFAIGVVHSYLGERFILIRLFRSSRIPHLFGSDFFTKRTLRFAWHLTTVAWWGLGFLVWSVSRETADPARVVLLTVGAVFFLSGAMALAASKGKHLSWIVFWSIAGLVYYTVFSSVDSAQGAGIPEQETPTASETTTMAACPADSVLQHLFDLLQNGQAGEAPELFLMHNPDQKKAVSRFVEEGVVFFADHRIINRVVETIADGRLALCAFEQTSPDFPEKYELEKAFLVLEGENWRILPQPQDHRSRLNGLSTHEKAGFDALLTRFNSFKRVQKGSRDQ